MATLKVDTITSADTPTVSITDGASISGVTTFSSDINIADKIVHTGDTNTAIRFADADTITAETGGSERVRITSAGKFGVNTTSPEGTLSVDGSIAVSSNGVTVTPSGYDLKIRSNTSKLGIHCDSGSGTPILEFGTGGSTGCCIFNADATPMRLGTVNTERMRIRGDGRISIGSSLAITGVCTAAAFVPTEGQTSHRNIIINGDMSVAQRGTSDTSANYYTTVDRWNYTASGTEENLTREQTSLSSSDTGPYEKGFRKCWRITNGNQTGGADAGGYVIPQYHVEARDLACSGWNYKSASSYITLSFWVKSSVSQTFYGFFRTLDGTGQAYSFSYSASSTWTKVTKTIPGNSNIDINNDSGSGLALYLPIFMGTDRTNSGNVEETWAAYASSNRTKDTVTTWYTTNDALWHITGVQLEVGSVATPFEHRSYADELSRCQRYYQRWTNGYAPGNAVGTSDIMIGLPLNIALRSAPSIAAMDLHRSGNKSTTISIVSVSYTAGDIICEVRVGGWTGGNAVTDEVAYVLTPTNNTVMELSAEL